jgi:hypothetical protein
MRSEYNPFSDKTDVFLFISLKQPKVAAKDIQEKLLHFILKADGTTKCIK